MEHDEKCELVNFIIEMSDRVTFTKDDTKKLRDMTRPIMCACRHRARCGKTALGWGISQPVLNKMRENFQLTLANHNIGIPHQVIVSRSALTPRVREQNGRVIEVDFRTRRRLSD